LAFDLPLEEKKEIFIKEYLQRNPTLLNNIFQVFYTTAATEAGSSTTSITAAKSTLSCPGQ